ncbi:MAG: class I SAM-dependent RNA methyltransferase [Treponema sp.]|jgi:putative N6-adenine-specific DNA methylase|nr:class I SAM-dependent RNA methyltransferase [Treponema sp.]
MVVSMNTLVALCAVGAEKILGNEIKQLGYALTGSVPGRVSFVAGDEGLYRANLCLRTADRVYLQMASFDAGDFDALFDGAYKVDWQDFFKKDAKIVVDKVRSHGSRLASEHSVQKVVHKAIYQKLSDNWRMRVMPESGFESDVRVYIDKDRALLLLDLSGAPLHKRGYRREGGAAPLRETVAAVLLQCMAWRRKTPLHDPFCGSGTIVCEAVLYAYNVAPGFGRRFALENLAVFDPQAAADIRNKEAANIRPDCVARVSGSDIDGNAAELARINAEHACVLAGRALQTIGSDAKIKRPEFRQADFADLKAPYEEGVLIGNPPYGERLGDEAEADALYRRMGCVFQNFPGWKSGFLTAREGFETALGRKAESRKKITGGNLDTCFYIFV